MINHIFTTPIYKTNVILEESNRLNYIDKAESLLKTLPQNKNWRCDTFTTLDKYDMINDPLFKDVINEIKSHVIKFSKEFGCGSDDVSILDSWINVARPGDYQEYHIHTGSHFSIAYYLQSQQDSGNIVFRSHEADTDMFPLPIRDLTPLSYKTMSFEPQNGMLLIFRSNLRHMVEKNLSDNNRISISMNLNVK